MGGHDGAPANTTPTNTRLVSEEILNGTSAQLDYTVPFTLFMPENTGQKTN